jgi:hypothetical protein
MTTHLTNFALTPDLTKGLDGSHETIKACVTTLNERLGVIGAGQAIDTAILATLQADDRDGALSHINYIIRELHRFRLNLEIAFKESD